MKFIILLVFTILYLSLINIYSFGLKCHPGGKMINSKIQKNQEKPINDEDKKTNSEPVDKKDELIKEIKDKAEKEANKNEKESINNDSSKSNAVKKSRKKRKIQ